MKKIAFAFASLMFTSLGAIAQDAPKQTAENAHLFLQVVVEQNGMQFEKYTPNVSVFGRGPFNIARFRGKDARNPDHGSDEFPLVENYYFMDPFKVTDMFGTRCKSQISWDYDPYAKMYAFNTWGDLNPHYRARGVPRSERIDNIEFLPDIRDALFEVDWSKVSGITVEEYGSKARISVIGGGRFTVPTMDLGKRVQYAMEFLKNACDPTASTGF